MRELNELIDKYRKVTKHPVGGTVDPLSYPEHFNGTWMPWVKLSENEIQFLSV